MCRAHTMHMHSKYPTTSRHVTSRPNGSWHVLHLVPFERGSRGGIDSTDCASFQSRALLANMYLGVFFIYSGNGLVLDLFVAKRLGE